MNKNQRLQKQLFEVSKSRGRNSKLLSNARMRQDIAATLEWLEETEVKRDKWTQHKPRQAGNITFNLLVSLLSIIIVTVVVWTYYRIGLHK